MGDMANLGFPWGRIILSLATLAAVALAVGFILIFLVFLLILTASGIEAI